MNSSGRLRSVTQHQPEVEMITLSSDSDDDCPSSSKRSRIPSPTNIRITEQFSLAGAARVKQEKESSPVAIPVSTNKEKEVAEVSRHQPTPPPPPQQPPPKQPPSQQTPPLRPPPQQPPVQKTSPLLPPPARPPPADQIQRQPPLRHTTPPHPHPPPQQPPLQKSPPLQPSPARRQNTPPTDQIQRQPTLCHPTPPLPPRHLPPPKEPSTSGPSKTIITAATVTPPVVSPPMPQPPEEPAAFGLGDQFIKNIWNMKEDKVKLEKEVKVEKQKREEAYKELNTAKAEVERLRSLMMHGDTRSGQRDSEVAQLRTEITKLKEEDDYSKKKLSSVSDTIKFLQRQMIEILREAEVETGEGDPNIQNFIHVQTTPEARQSSLGTGPVSMNQERCLNQITEMEKSFAQQFKELSAQDDALKSEVAAAHALLGELQGLMGVGTYPDSVNSSPVSSPKLSNENGDIIEME